MRADELVGIVIDAINATGVQYMVTGSLASNAYGIARMTRDADFVLQLRGNEIRAIADSLRPHFRLDDQMAFETITSTYKQVLEHEETGFKVELFELSQEEFDQARFARRTRAHVMGRSSWLPTPEDVLIQKLRWSQHHGRNRDLEDARHVLHVQTGKLDEVYLESWCRKHGTLELLNRLRAESL